MSVCVRLCTPGTGWSSPVIDRDTSCLYLSGKRHTCEAGTPGHQHPLKLLACPLFEWSGDHNTLIVSTGH